MSDLLASKGVGSDRVVARAITGVAPAAPPRPASSVVTPAREASPADVAAVGGTAARLAAVPPVDSERVAQIKKAIANGTFPILPATIADQILALRYDWMSRDPQSL